MGARDIARGGILAALAVALQYAGGLSPWMGLALCAMSGVATAVPLIRHDRVKYALLLYLAAAVLSALIVPRKGLSLLYICFFGLYPIIKYGIESRMPRSVQPGCKLIYFNLLLAGGWLLVRHGMAQGIELPGHARLALFWLAANAVFECYDIGLSRLIASLRKTLPPG